MAKQKLTTKQIAELRSDYEAWNPHDPNSMSADELAARHGISKQTLYTYRDKWLEEDRRLREKAGHNGSANADSNAGMADAIVFLTAELARARARIDELEAELRDRREVKT